MTLVANWNVPNICIIINDCLSPMFFFSGNVLCMI